MDNMTGIKRLLFMGVVIGFTLIAILLLPTNKEEDVADQPTTISTPISNDDILNPGNVPDGGGASCAAEVSAILEDYPEAFESQEAGEEWCENCMQEEGIIDISHDAGSAFCNHLTSDAGTECTDSSECEGTCLAALPEDTSGLCSEYERLSGGCGWYEVIDGDVVELCVD